MKWNIDISPRDALAAPTTESQTYILSVIILVASLLSILGTGWIMLSFSCCPNLRSFRHQLILGLAISDCVMALNFVSSCSMNISGRSIGAPGQERFCSFNGFMTQVFVIQTDYWVLLIALSTYFILADHRNASSWVQQHVLILASLPWIFSVLWAAIGLAVAGYGDIGAWCWFTSDEVRLLVNFVPRWFIILLMLGMYARLYRLLSRNHWQFSSDVSVSGTISGSRSRTAGDGTDTSRSRRAVNDSHVGYGPTHSSANSRRLRKAARLMLTYPIAYMLIWALPTAIRIYQASVGKPAPFSLQTVDKVCIAIQGFADAAVYGVNEPSLSSWRNLLLSPKLPTESTTNPPQRNQGGEHRPRRTPFSRLSDAITRDTSSLDISLAQESSSVTYIAGSTRDDNGSVSIDLPILNNKGS